MKLVIVESPAKSKTIGRYLGDEYIVEASVGHIRDLATSGKGGLGIDVDNGFSAKYVVSKGKASVVKELTKLKNNSDEVIIATDPDREGEAIAWHLANVLDLDIKTTKRLEFHEITHDSIVEALKNPRTIDLDIVKSQEARRIIDRILGFKLSKLLQNKINSQSAGRVQSVTLKFIVDREKEIEEFVPEEYWTIDATIKNGSKQVKTQLNKYKGEKVKLSNKADCDEVFKNLSSEAKVVNIKKVNKNISSKDPFITSTLQQEANSKFGFRTKLTSLIAQKLYEGVETDEGLTGLITYIRTDSTRLSDVFVGKAQEYIEKNFGANYYRGKHASKNKEHAQDAHEAIRPTSLSRTPEKMRVYLNDEEYKIYKLIFDRAVASLMVDKVIETTTVTLENGEGEFTLNASKTIFDGFDILKLEDAAEEDISSNEGDICKLNSLKENQHFTEAPARYNEGKVVKIMEEKGIGRPSTYTSTIQTLVLRKYVSSTKKGLVPTEQGKKTVAVLRKYFPELMDEQYTANMETSLDLISEGEVDELKVISDFYYPFVELFEKNKEEMYKDPLEYTGEICPQCGSKLVVRHGRNGDFVACSNYPACKYIKKDNKEPAEEVGRNCPNCGRPLVYRKAKDGTVFIGCSNYPACRYVETKEDHAEEQEKRYCPDCGAILVKRKSKRGYFYGCSNYPKCKHIEGL